MSCLLMKMKSIAFIVPLQEHTKSWSKIMPYGDKSFAVYLNDVKEFQAYFI